MDLYRKLAKRPNIFKNITGISLEKFKATLDLLEPKLSTLCKRKIKTGRPYQIKTAENQLACLLIYYRTYITQLFLSFKFNVDAATVCRTIKRLEPHLKNVLAIKKEKVLSYEAFEYLLLDATEQRIQRPKKDQEKYYSGKKKAHTIKTELRITNRGRIVGVSKSVPGSKHDFRLYKEEVPIPENVTVLCDSGYRGIEKLHSKSILPQRKPYRKSLSSEDKEKNKALARDRVKVEHKFAQMKTNRILKDVFRNPIATYGIKMAIIAGITNMKCGF